MRLRLRYSSTTCTPEIYPRPRQHHEGRGVTCSFTFASHSRVAGCARSSRFRFVTFSPAVVADHMLVRFLMFFAAALAPSYGYVLPFRRLPSQQIIRPPTADRYGQTRNHSLIWPPRSPGSQCCLVAFAAVGTPLTAAQLAITQLAHFMVFPICLSTLFVACETCSRRGCALPSLS